MTVRGPTFFLKNIAFDADGNCDLAVDFGSPEETLGRIVFRYVRNFFFFKESYFYREIGAYEREVIFQGHDGGVFRILRSPILDPILKGRFEGEEPHYFVVATADFCLEVVSFDDPEVTLFQVTVDSRQ